MQAEIVITGGGLAGASLAIQILRRRPETKVVVLEKSTFPLPDAALKVGESTVEIGAHYFNHHLGAKEHLDKDQLPKLGLRYFLENPPHNAIEQRLEVGATRYLPTPTYQIDRGRFENFLRDEVLRLGGTFIEGARVTDISLGSTTQVVRYVQDGLESEFVSRWVVDASGRTSLLKKRLSLQEKSGHECNSAWWRYEGEFNIDDWCTDEQWKKDHSGIHSRWFSTNHLMGKGYWVWVIPLATNHTSFGIVADGDIHPFTEYNTFERALNWLDRHEPQCGSICREHRDAFKDFIVLKNYSHSATKVYSGERWGITGEAGVFLDPFYSPGSDFIAISNSYLTDLFLRDIAGESIGQRSEIYNDLYLRFFHSTLRTFKNQYPIFGNPIVMPVKVYWDWCYYWVFLAKLFFGDKLADLSFISSERATFERLEELGDAVQLLLREWDQADRPPRGAGIVNLSDHPILRTLNAQLSENPDEQTFRTQFHEGVELLENIAAEIASFARARANVPYPKAIRSKPAQLVCTPFFENVVGETSLESSNDRAAAL